MQKIFPVTLFILLMSTMVSAQTQKPTEEAAVQQVVTKLFDGIGAIDMQAVGNCCTKEVIILESGAIWNLDTLESKISPMKNKDFKRVNQINFIRTEIKANMAWVVYDNVADMQLGDRKMHKHWLESAVLVKEGADWKVSLLHSTTIN